jgi:DNA-binding transcriptional MocR family regulator/dihydrodipicolinate reductase
MPQYSQYIVPNSNEMVNFGVGQPDTSKLPIKWFNTTLAKIASENLSSEILQYGSIPGYESVRKKLSKWLTHKYYSPLKDKSEKLDVRHTINEDQIFMTNGNTGALQLIMSTFIETGDEIIIEDPTYFIAKNMFNEFGLNINTVPMESDGLNVDELENKILEIIDKYEKYPQNKIFLYTIPIHHNPTSITLSHEKRIKIGELCEKYPNFYVIADEVYHFLSFNDTIDVYPMADYHPNILSLGSFSKLLAPGLRIGWIYHNTLHPLIDEDMCLLDSFKKSAILDSSGAFNPFGYLLLEKALDDKSLDEIVDNNIQMLNERCNIMCEFLQIKNENIKYIIPKGGYFLWIKLNLDDTTSFLDYAIANKVKFHPGIKFGEKSGSYIRLSFSYYKCDDLIIGLERLLDAYNIFIKIKVSICGSTGKLGTLLTQEINNNNMFYLNEPITRNIKVTNNTNVIVDVSSSEGTHNLIKYLNNNKINKPIIIGTTGITTETMGLIEDYSKQNPVALISNFSEGIPKIKKLLEELNKLNNNWEFSMIEKHHTNKKDSPSGTAKTLSSLIDRKCDVESVREEDIIGYHQIKLTSNEEEIIISHNAKSRNIFAKGCIRFINWIINKEPGIYYDMDNFIPDYDVFFENNLIIIVTENKDIEKIYQIKKGDFYVTINKNNSIYELTVYNKSLEINTYNITTQKCVANYLNKYYGLNTGHLLQNTILSSFKIENKTIILQVTPPKFIQLTESYINNLSMMLLQLSGLEVLGIAKYNHNENHIIIEVKNDLNKIESEVITNLGNIINGEYSIDNRYYIDFIHFTSDKKIIIKSYDKYVQKEKFNSSGCIVAFEYISYNLDLKYNTDYSYNIISKDKNATVYYNKHNYFYSELKN